jgi:pimeloyl-ACP methyl ester carboxylesterase
MPTAKVNGIDLNYREAGEGFPIVLVHGYTGNLRNWALSIPALTPRFRTVSVDLRGHGHSGKPLRPEDYRPEAMAGDVYALIRELGIAECYLVGHSMGGMIAQHLILTHPEPFRALILVDTAAERLQARTAERLRLIEMAKTHGMDEVFEEQLRAQADVEQLRANPGFLAVWKQQFMLTSREAYIYCAQGIADRKPLLDELPRIAVPTLVVCGENDEPFVGPSQRIHERIRGSELVMIPECGHTPQIEKPGEFNSIVLGFLARVHEGVAAGS